VKTPILLCIISVFLFSCTTTPSPTLTTQPPNNLTTPSAKLQTNKSDYKDLDIPPASKKLYDEAKAKNESWVTKVEEVANQAAGKSSESGKVSVYFTAQDNAIP
jgi:hypothetical protein